MRRPLIAGNWKMHNTGTEAKAFGREFRTAIKDVDGVDVLLCPSFPALGALATTLEGTAVRLGAQNVHAEPEGAFTGEVSAAMLTDAGCTYVIVGHSERRQLMGETDDIVNGKVKAAVAGGLHPVVCVGENIEQRRAGETEAFVTGQVRAALADVAADAVAEAVIAYEPIWAIGTGETATPEEAEAVAGVVRKTVADLFGDDVAEKVRIQYGGSVNADNIASFMAQPNIDGALVGGASLDADSFARIVKNTEATTQ